MKLRYSLSVFIFMLISCSPDMDLDFSDAQWQGPDFSDMVMFSVLDSLNDEPVGGATIYIEHLKNNETKSITVTTDQNGSASASKIGIVTYVRVSANGYKTRIFGDGDYSNPIYLETEGS